MKNAKKTFTQRNHKRLEVKDGVCAVLRYKPVEMGLIINMSRDGLAVRYTTRKAQLSQMSEIDIFMLDCHFYIAKIPVKTIADFELTDKSPFGSETTRQRCFQFGEMKPGQLFQLDYCLENYIIKRRSDEDRRQMNVYQHHRPKKRYAG